MLSGISKCKRNIILSDINHRMWKFFVDAMYDWSCSVLLGF